MLAPAAEAWTLPLTETPVRRKLIHLVRGRVGLQPHTLPSSLPDSAMCTLFLRNVENPDLISNMDLDEFLLTMVGHNFEII